MIGIAAEGGRAADMLAKYGIDAETLKEAVLKVVGQGDYVFNGYFGYTPRVKMILELSQAISRQLGTNYVSVEHMLYAVMREQDCLGNRLMREMGADFSEIEKKMCIRDRDWRSDKVMRKLEAMMIAANEDEMLIISGTGEVITPDCGVVAIGSGGTYAQAAATALIENTELSAREIAEKALKIASEICIFTNSNITVEEV